MRESGVKTEKTLDQAWVWWLQVSSAVRGRAAGVTTHQSACWPGLQLDYTGDPLKASFCNICVRLCFNLFFTFVSILQTASWWRSVRVSAALPGYLTSLSVVGLDSGTAGLPCTTPHSSTVPQSVSILSSISCLCFRSVGARFLWVSSYSASTSPSQDCSKSGGLNVSLLKASSFLLMTIFVNLCYPLPS